jgi:phage tail-like protein
MSIGLSASASIGFGGGDGGGSDAYPYPFTTFNFQVEVRVPGVSERVCQASFAECDGLEVTMDVKSIREGGNNGQQIRLPGPLSFGQLTLKRGMTDTFDLWAWFAAVHNGTPAALRSDLRPDAEVVLIDPERQKSTVTFVLTRCLPLKLKAPALNAASGLVAIEELQVAYESLTLRPGGPL